MPVFKEYMKIKTGAKNNNIYASLHDQMRLNYLGISFELYISLKRGDIKLPYGERIKFLT